jgi:hypothetical protein
LKNKALKCLTDAHFYVRIASLKFAEVAEQDSGQAD